MKYRTVKDLKWETRLQDLREFYKTNGVMPKARGGKVQNTLYQWWIHNKDKVELAGGLTPKG